MHTSDFFCFTSDSTLPPSFFRGYAFCGADLIIGPDGLDLYPGDVPFHEDGRYFVLKKTRAGFTGGTDYKGNMKMFTYKGSQGWAFSNSFARLVDEVKKRGWSITVRPEHIAAWNLKSAFWQQLWSFETAVSEITLVPSHALIHINSGQLFIKGHDSLERFADYETAMENFLNIWLGRAGTMMQTPLKVDITGGVDSRVNLALFLAASRTFGTPAQMTFNCGAFGRHKDDHAVAKTLSGKFDFALNKKLETDTVSMDSHDMFSLWRLTCLGAYSPLYMPPQTAHPKVVHVMGGGGEGHRPFYAHTNIRAHLQSVRGPLSDANFDIVLQSIYRSIKIAGNKVPPMMLHYREFRDRLHSGLLGNYSIRIMPLASRHLYAATRFKTAQELERNQILFDIMNAATPELMTQPYDNNSKMPSEVCLTHLLDRPQLVPMSGKIYSGTIHPSSNTRGKAHSPLTHLADAAAHTNACDIAAQIAREGKISHPQDGIEIHNALLADLLNV